MKRNQVLKDAEWIAECSDYVSINKEKIEEFASQLTKNDFVHWTKSSPVSFEDLSIENQLRASFIFNAISFNYHTSINGWKVEHDGEFLNRGTWSMLASIRRAIDEGVDVLNPVFLADISVNTLESICRGEGRLPMLHVRAEYLRELGTGLMESYSGSMWNFIQGAPWTENECLDLVLRITDEFPSFRDSSEYKFETVQFNKRAQLFVSDVYHITQQNPKLAANLTACADYKLPRSLQQRGILEYNTSLLRFVMPQTYIPRNSEFEVEIRGNTIAAVEGIRKALLPRIDVTPMQINDLLWTENLGGERDAPYHLCYTTTN